MPSKRTLLGACTKAGVFVRRHEMMILMRFLLRFCSISGGNVVFQDDRGQGGGAHLFRAHPLRSTR